MMRSRSRHRCEREEKTTGRILDDPYEEQDHFPMVRLRVVVAVLTLIVGIPLSATAQEWPNRPVRFIVPFPAGGSTDVGARLVGEYLSRSLHQQIVVENKSGANGTIGIETAAKSPADGYTVLVVTDAVSSNPHVYKMNVDPLKGLTPVIQRSRQPIVLAAHPSLRVASLAELMRSPGSSRGCATRPGAGSAPSTWWRNGLRRSPASSSSRCPIAAAGRRSMISSPGT